ncbi:MAG TPA: hypothetical protein EYH22_03570 [Candidatus Nanopusillus sp.]|nr:hypothetical protein [Candidatus Nanopusillus sp.]
MDKFIVAVILMLVGTLLLLYFLFYFSKGSIDIFNQKYNETAKRIVSDPILPVLFIFDVRRLKRSSVQNFIVYLILALVVILAFLFLYNKISLSVKHGSENIFGIANKTIGEPQITNITTE